MFKVLYEHYMLFSTGTQISEIVARPIISTIGFQTITIVFQECSVAEKYAIKCNNVSSLGSKVVYSRKPPCTFDDLNENYLYEFQVAVTGEATHGVWSHNSYPIKPSGKTGILLLLL